MATYVEYFASNVQIAGIHKDNPGGPRWNVDPASGDYLGPTFRFSGMLEVFTASGETRIRMPANIRDVSIGDRVSLRIDTLTPPVRFAEVLRQPTADELYVTDLGFTLPGLVAGEVRVNGQVWTPTNTDFDLLLTRMAAAKLSSLSRTRPWRVNVKKTADNYSLNGPAIGLGATSSNPITLQGYQTVPGDLVASEDRPKFYKSGGLNLLTLNTPDTAMRFIDLDFELNNPGMGSIDVLVLGQDGYTLDRCKITLSGPTAGRTIKMIKCTAPAQNIRNCWIDRPIGNADSTSIHIEPTVPSKRGATIIGNFLSRAALDLLPTTGAAIRLLGGQNHLIENNLAVNDVYFLRSEKGGAGNATPTFRAERNTILSLQKGAILLDWPAGGGPFQRLVVQANIFCDVTAEAVLQAIAGGSPAAWGFIGYNVLFNCPTVLNGQILDTREGDRVVGVHPLANVAGLDYRNTTAAAGSGLLHYLARIGGRVASVDGFKNQLSPGAANRQTTI